MHGIKPHKIENKVAKRREKCRELDLELRCVKETKNRFQKQKQIQK